MDLSKTIIVPKLSKFEYDQVRLKLSGKQVLARYRNQGANADRIIQSHERQKSLLERLTSAFPESKIISRNDLTGRIGDEASLIISFGGDNHLQYVSHYANTTPILGINSDPERSEGALTGFSETDYKRLVTLLESKKYKTEQWPRLQLILNGKKMTPLATTEIFLGESERTNMSRHVLEWKGQKEEQKCSGLLIATKAGSTGWYHSAANMDKKPFDKNEARFFATETYTGKKSGNTFTQGSFRKEDIMTVRSLNDSNGIAVIDASTTYQFPEGSVARIVFGKPLKVIKPNC